LIEAVNAFEAINLRASVDLPSGKGDGVKNDTISFPSRLYLCHRHRKETNL
jgi:hypothetical protein